MHNSRVLLPALTMTLLSGVEAEMPQKLWRTVEPDPGNAGEREEILTTNTSVSAAPKRSLNWRVVDIVVASVLGVACGFVFLGWNAVGYAWFEAMDLSLIHI